MLVKGVPGGRLNIDRLNVEMLCRQYYVGIVIHYKYKTASGSYVMIIPTPGKTALAMKRGPVCF